MYTLLTDTDIFLLLLYQSNRINGQGLYIHLVKGWVDLKCLNSKLGDECSNALLSLHAITGTDTTGKLDGKSKEFWFRRFLTVKLGNKSLVDELTKFQESPEENTAIESFICRGYLYKSLKEARRKFGEFKKLIL